ncbi:MAG: TonB family protein, partial [Candidatus Eisenbacteria bacterium]|nr:TonB family protein [Candidatus Eisenbacteria bacterium]
MRSSVSRYRDRGTHGVLIVLTGLLLFGSSYTTAARAEDSARSGGSAGENEVLAPDVEPELTDFVSAVYPERELREGVEGEVLLQLLLNETGDVDSVWVVQGLTAGLDDAARAAALQFRFRPAMAQGVPVPVYVQFAYRFSLSEQAEAIEDVVNLRGQLRERGTRIPVTGALVVARIAAPDPLPLPLPVYLARIAVMPGQFVEEDRVSVYTDSTGTFAFHTLPPGKIVVTSPNSGYEPFESTETITNGERLEAT